ncbi:MAG TPA: hypothetical protein DCS07_17815 [Bdellovibrionales bacterium]|nr:hypothetical protein [Bdellovibrionales bacterium]
MLKAYLEEKGNPKHIRWISHEQNFGLSRTLNETFEALETPYALTCHCDCFFGREDYVAQMVTLMDAHPEAATITGQPQISPTGRIPFAEKVSLTENLMDIFQKPIPPGVSPEQWVIPVGFAEGRCDIFRKSALQAVGYYDTTVRLSGEDQLIAARMRQKGFAIYQAPAMPYTLSVSDSQNSTWKLLKHQHLLARTSPYVMFKNRETLQGMVGETAGNNRKKRTLLRLHHLFSSVVYCWLALFMILGLSPQHRAFWIPLLLVIAIKAWLFADHCPATRMKPLDLAGFALLQPPFDLIYTVGFTQGLYATALLKIFPDRKHTIQ